MSDKLYLALPPSLAAAASANAPKSARDLLQAHLPESDRKEIDNGLRKTVVLGKQRDNRPKGLKKKPARRKAGKYLTARERRDLGLFRLPRKGMRYADMTELHTLWLGYMRELLNLPQ
jgi:ribonuclease P protein subunit POP4